MTLNLNGANQNQLYIAGGKGIANDPYIIDNGVQQSWERIMDLSLWRQ